MTKTRPTIAVLAILSLWPGFAPPGRRAGGHP
jgi:hypothetical protein